jgi:hypothetical protein
LCWEWRNVGGNQTGSGREDFHDTGIVPRASQMGAGRAGGVQHTFPLECRQTLLYTSVRDEARVKPQLLTLIDEIPVLEAVIDSLYKMVESTNNL